MKTIATIVVFLISQTVFSFMGRPIKLLEDVNQVSNVRLMDVANHTNIIPDLEKVSKKIHSRLERLIDNEFKIEEILNIYIRSTPRSGQDSTILLPLTSVVRTKENNIYFLDVDVLVKGKKITDSQLVRSLPIQNMNFTVKTSLKDRKMIIEDKSNNIKMVMPIGVGSFDEGVLNEGYTTILTPRFENAFLDKQTAIHHRKKPLYFAKKPFLRITRSTNPDKSRTSIGFHAQPNLDPFVRAFDSHGCMRMQTNDLEMLYYLITLGPQDRIPLTVRFTLNDKSEHPMTKIDTPYKTVLNIGSKEEPRYTMDRDGLVQVAKKYKGASPVEKLVDSSGDNYHEKFDYAMAWREKARYERIYKTCMDKIEDRTFVVDPADYTTDWKDYRPTMDLSRRALKKAERAYNRAIKANAKKYNKAVKEMKKEEAKFNELKADASKSCRKDASRTTTARDRLYRYWVHGTKEK